MSDDQPYRETPGRDALWQEFGLSRASWLTLPRVLLHEMPDDWQASMATLLREFDEAFPNMPEMGTTVRVTNTNGRMIQAPAWLLNYRHPDRAAIDELRTEMAGAG